MPTFSAALLAGGESKRMGRDKALLPTGDSGLLLWQRQWQLLETLGADELFWSGLPRPGIPDRARIVVDVVKDAGPLAGISTCLDLIHADLLIALAVDLPEMSSAVLLNLMERCEPKRGAVYQHDSFFEPLAAIYPKSLHVLAKEHLAQGRYAMQEFIREAIKREMMTALPLPETELPCFKNVNTPEDL
jgi:molybdopterin-guanine dinucleotide biosynthesis protein A